MSTSGATGPASGRPPRVALMVSGLPSSGAENVLVHSLAALRAAGIEPVLLTLNERRDGPLADEVAASGVRRIDIGTRRMLAPGGIVRLLRVVRRERFDLLHANDQDSIILGGLVRLLTATPLVISRHVLIEPTDDAKERARARLVLAVARWAADHIIVVAEAVGPALAAQTGVGLDRITAVHNGIDVAAYDADRMDRSALRAELGWPADAPVVLMVAWLRAGKGHELLPGIVSRVADRVPDVRFGIVGGGALPEDVRRSLTPLGSAVELLGHRDDVPDLLHAADVVLLPSWSEALPTVLMEAGAAGRPAVASDVGGVGEILEDAVTGHVVPAGDVPAFADRLVDLLTDPSAARKMGRLAHERISDRFTIRAQARATVAVYRRVLAGRRRR